MSHHSNASCPIRWAFGTDGQMHECNKPVHPEGTPHECHCGVSVLYGREVTPVSAPTPTPDPHPDETADVGGWEDH
jgi:hypothetical protein